MSNQLGSSQNATTQTPKNVAVEQVERPKDCLACRIIGTGALGGVGIYALNQSRAHAPGSPLGKRIMAGVGVCFLVAGALRWTTKDLQLPQPFAQTGRKESVAR